LSLGIGYFHPGGFEPTREGGEDGDACHHIILAFRLHCGSGIFDLNLMRVVDFVLVHC
jgi:hypothetical protein